MTATIREELARQYPAVSETVPRVRRELAEFAARAGMSGERVDAVRLAVTEAVTNVVRHAYRDEVGVVEVAAGVVADEELWILVADRGVGQQEDSPNPGLGFGLGLIARMADELVVTERAEGGTELRMRFLLPRPEPQPA